MIERDHLGDEYQLRGEKFPYSVKSRLGRLAARVLASLRAAPPSIAVTDVR